MMEEFVLPSPPLFVLLVCDVVLKSRRSLLRGGQPRPNTAGKVQRSSGPFANCHAPEAQSITCGDIVDVVNDPESTR